MNIFKFEIKKLIPSTLIWASGIGAFILIYMVFFPLLMEENDAMMDIMDNFPEDMLAFLGMNGELSFGSLMGYFGLTFSFIWIPISIQSSYLGFHILSVEERELTADFLMTKPVSRTTILLSKVGASVTALLSTAVAVGGFSLLSLVLFGANQDVNFIHVLSLLASIPVFQLFFLGIGMMVSVMIRKVESVIGYSMGLGFGMYIISSFGEMLTIDAFKFLSPYSYFVPDTILYGGTWDLVYTLIALFVICTTFTLTYIFYQRRNIASL